MIKFNILPLRRRGVLLGSTLLAGCVLVVVGLSFDVSARAAAKVPLQPRIDVLARFDDLGATAGLAVAMDGTLAVLDTKHQQVIRLDSNGGILSEWGPDFGDGTQATGLAGLAAGTQGDWYVLDDGSGRVSHLDAAGHVVGAIDLTNLATYGPRAIGVDGSGNVYLVDTGNNRVLMFGANSEFISSISTLGSGPAQVKQPVSIAFGADGAMFVGGLENPHVAGWDARLQPTSDWKLDGVARGVAVDSLGRVFVLDATLQEVRMFDTDGNPLGEIGAAPGPPLPVSGLSQVGLSPDGSALWVLGGNGLARLDLLPLAGVVAPSTYPTWAEPVWLAGAALALGSLIVLGWPSARRWWLAPRTPARALEQSRRLFPRGGLVDAPRKGSVAGRVILAVGLALGLLIRLWIILHGVEVADVQHLHDVGGYFLQGHNPYSLPPVQSNFPPLALFIEASSIFLVKVSQVPFYVVFKLWPLAADLGTAIVIYAVLVRTGTSPRRAAWWTWFLLLNPVSILITADHGNLDPVTNFFSVLSLALIVIGQDRRWAWSALSLGIASAIKPNPILLMPFFAASRGLRVQQRVGYVLLSILPTLITLAPFYFNDPMGVLGNLAGYTGEYDFGFAAPLRAAWYMKSHSIWLPGTVGQDLTSASRFTFLAGYFALWCLFAGRLSLARLATLVYVLFYVLFAGLSAQYTVWVLPFAILAGEWAVCTYSLAATYALVGFYLTFWPDILLGQFNVFTALQPDFVSVYFWGTLTLWAVNAVWLASMILRFRDAGPFVSVRHMLKPLSATRLERARLNLTAVALIAFAAVLLPVIRSLQFMARALGS